MSKPIYTQCSCWCRHFHREKWLDSFHSDFQSYSCDAFPMGIPDEIWYEKHEHHAPHPGDKGILFERLTQEEAERILKTPAENEKKAA